MVYRCDVDLNWTKATGSPGVNTWFYRATESGGGGPNDDLDKATTALRTFYQALSSAFTQDCTVSFSGQWIGANSTDSGKTYVGNAWTFQGQGGTSAAPPALCLLLRRGAATGGRSGKGHAYIGPLSLAYLGPDGRVDPQWLPGAALAAQTLLSPGGSDGAFGVYSRGADLFRDYTDMSFAKTFAVLRSRRD